MSPEPLLTTQEVATLLHVHPKHVYRLLKKGLPARRVGGEWRFARGEVLAWSGGRPEAGEPATAAPARAASVPAAGAPPLVAANGDVAVMALLALAARRSPLLLGFVQADKTAGVELLLSGATLATGSHAGSFPTHVGDERVVRIHLVQREIGLLSRPRSRPHRIRDLARLKLASRPATAGVRQYLDSALRGEGLDPEAIHRRALLLASHLDVVCAVAAGAADVGLASRAWGDRAGLSFHRLATEEYGLIVKAKDLGDPRVVRLCEVAQSKEYRTEVGAVAGYDVEGAGDIRYDA